MMFIFFKRFSPVSFKGIFFCGLCLMLCSGCRNIWGLHRDLVRLKKSAEISGEVLIAPDSPHPIFVALYREEAGEHKLYSYWIVYRSDGSGEFRFMVHPGKYYLFAFEDKNENIALNQDEKIGWYGKPSLLRIEAGELRSGIKISLQNPNIQRVVFEKLYTLSENSVPMQVNQRRIGEVDDLNDARFEARYATIGLWEPVKFLEGLNSGLFFLQPYQKEKIPVLFVHGAGGYPQQWQPMIDKLDKSRFQPWILHYPSGLRMDLLGETLERYLAELHLRYRFERVFIVAHSMGGLIARKAINRQKNNNGPEFIKLLITISTPWRGHSGAEYGTKRSPLVIPSWYDMAKGSRFLRELRKTELSPHLKFYLLFGFRGDGVSDGTASFRSLLDLKMQEEAVKVIGFDEDHVSILSSRDAIKKINELLSKAVENDH